jgi:hypothetical protein
MTCLPIGSFNMKQPRIEDFDPKAPKHTLKSPLEGMPAIETPSQITRQPENSTPKEVSPAIQETSNGTQPYAPYGRTPSTPRTPTKRLIIRHPFEIYQDQLESLRHLSVEERKEGGTGSMSKMVREAIDNYLKQREG